VAKFVCTTTDVFCAPAFARLAAINGFQQSLQRIIAGAIFFLITVVSAVLSGLRVLWRRAGISCADERARYSDRMNKTLFDQAGQFILPE
jgi:hypothetical protein